MLNEVRRMDLHATTITNGLKNMSLPQRFLPCTEYKSDLNHNITSCPGNLYFVFLNLLLKQGKFFEFVMQVNETTVEVMNL